MTREQFITLVNGEQEQLRRFLLALCCGNRDEADDIAQETLVKAYLSSSGYQEQGKFTAWIYRIAHNTFLDHQKRPTKNVSIDAAEQMQDSSLSSDRNFQYQELYLAISTLSPKERTAMLLFYIKGYSIKEISKIVECSEDAVKKQLSRGREELKSKLTR